MKKKILAKLLIIGLLVLQIGVAATEITANTNDSEAVITTETTDETNLDETEPADGDETAIPDEDIVEPVANNKDETAEPAYEVTKPVNKDNDKVVAPKDNTEKETKQNAIKEELKAKKELRAEKRLDAKDFIKDLRRLFKDSDTKTRREILADIAELKKDLKDYSIGVFVKGLHVDFEEYENVKPIIEDNRTLVPLRAIVEKLGTNVQWINDTQTIILTKGEINVTLQIGSKTAIVNSKEVELDVAPVIKNDRTLLPVRFLAETFGLNVDWDENSQTVVID